MKRIILVIAIFLLKYQSYGQFFIGYTETEVLIEVEKMGGIKINKGTNINGVPYVNWYNKDGRCYNNVGFINGKVCLFNIAPINENSLLMWLGVFNRSYVKKDSNTWQAYNQGKGVDIKLAKGTYDDYYFTFTLTNDN